jgi:hypothetical protein
VSESLAQTLDKLPPWAVPATAALVVGFLLMRNNQGGSGSNTGLSRVYEPTPADPNLVALAQSEVAAKTEAFTSLTNMIGATEIAGIDANRDVAIIGVTSQRDRDIMAIQAGTEEKRINAQLSAATIQDMTRRILGRAQIDSEYMQNLDDNRTKASLGLAGYGAAERIAFGGFDIEGRRIDAGERVAFGGFGVEDRRTSAGERVSSLGIREGNKTERAGQKYDFWGGLVDDIIDGVTKVIPFL